MKHGRVITVKDLIKFVHELKVANVPRNTPIHIGILTDPTPGKEQITVAQPVQSLADCHGDGVVVVIVDGTLIG